MAAKRIFGHMPDLSSMPGWMPIPALGTRRRIQALMALGHSAASLAARTELHPEVVIGMAQGESEIVSVVMAGFIFDAYDTLSGTPGKCPKTRAYAEERRWGPPLAWDDIDDPGEEPKFGEAVPKYLCLIENFRELKDNFGFDRKTAAMRLGVQRSDIDSAFKFQRDRRASQKAA